MGKISHMHKITNNCWQASNARPNMCGYFSLLFWLRDREIKRNGHSEMNKRNPLQSLLSLPPPREYQFFFIRLSSLFNSSVIFNFGYQNISRHGATARSETNVLIEFFSK